MTQIITDLERVKEALEGQCALFFARNPDATHMDRQQYDAACLRQFDASKQALSLMPGIIEGVEAGQPIELYQCTGCEGIYQSLVTECDCSVAKAFSYKTLHAYAVAPAKDNV